MTRRHYFWFLFLLFHHSCNRCGREMATYEHKEWGAAVAINEEGVECTGTINGSPVLRLHGKITKNVPGIADPILGAVFMAQNQELGLLAPIIQKHEVKPQGTSGGGPVMNMLTPLDGGNFVNYERIEHLEQGNVVFDVSSLNPQKGLKSNTAYDTALFIKIGPHVFYTADKVRYTTPIQEDAAKVEMYEPEPKHTYDDGLKIQLSMEAGVSDWDSDNGSAKAGFFLIEQKKGPFSQVEVIERHLGNRDNSSIFSRDAGTLFEDGAGVILCLADDNFQGASTFSIDDVKAEEGLLKKGETYHVFGVVEQGSDYYVSTNLRPITLPEVDIALAMGDIEDKKLYVAGTDVKEFSVKLGGEITKQENATDPIAGFLFVPQDERPTDEALKKTISDATGSYSDGDTWLPAQGDHKVCVTYRDIGSGPVRLEEQTVDLLGHLDHKKDYKVYFWVQDHEGKGPVFLSEEKPLDFLYVERENSSVAEQIRLGNGLTFTCKLTTKELKNNAGAEFGILFTKKEITALEYTDMDEIAGKYSKEGATPTGWRHLDGDDRIYISGSTTPGIVKAEVGRDKDLAGGTTYHCYPVVCRQGMIYVLSKINDYKTAKEIINLSSFPVEIEDDANFRNDADKALLNAYMGGKFIFQVGRNKVTWVDSFDNEHRFEPNDHNHRDIIRAVIRIYCKGGEENQYIKYKVND